VRNSQPSSLLLLEFLENDIEVPTGAAASALLVVVLELIWQFEESDGIFVPLYKKEI